MHILLTPNAFKGSLSALEAAQAMAEGLRPFGGKISYTVSPVADGGDGTMRLLTQAMGGTLMKVKSTNVLGQEIETAFGWVENNRKAIIGLADVSGLRLVAEGQRDSLHSSTYGLGLVIKTALDIDPEELLIAVGGSATTDGGSGLLQALGLRYLDAEGREITDLPYGLANLETIVSDDLDRRLARIKVTVLCDVKNPLLGPNGAAAVFGPQKGATEDEVVMLEHVLMVWCGKIRDLAGVDVSDVPFGGAAGGVAAGLMGWTAAKPVSGIAYFLDALAFDRELREADYVFTGEGALDSQTLEGKGPFEVALRAKRQAIPVVAFTGMMPANKDALAPYFQEIIALSSGEEDRKMAMEQAKARLSKAVRKWVERQFRK